MKCMDKHEFEQQNVFGTGAANTAYAKFFIGQSFLNPLTDPKTGLLLANVTFEPGCRNNWHIHHAAKGGGQLLVCTAGGVLLGKVMCFVTHGKINPLIGSAGVSAVPMAARVSQKVGQEYNPRNYLLMHAMGPNVAGVIGSAVAAGILINMFG